MLRLGEKWNEKSPAIYSLWERNWQNIITIFTYPSEIRRVIYTTNAIESLNGVIRSRMKTKRILGSDESALKLVWIAVSKCAAEVDNADKQLVKSIKSLLCEIRRPFPESGIRKSHTHFT